jgi:hypothetical protein
VVNETSLKGARQRNINGTSTQRKRLAGEAREVLRPV